MDTPSSNSLMDRLRNWLSGERRPDAEDAEIKSFKDDQEREGAFDARDRGTQTVPITQIVGSVGRYQDFDNRFRFKVPSERFKSIMEAMKEGHPLPPVKLYQIKDEYYVLDGNHRVAAAKQLGHDEILATIMEFIPSKETLDNFLYRESVEFFEKTGLPRTIKLTEIGQYNQLLSQIHEHGAALKKERGKDVPLEDAARDWHKTIYSPFCSIIKRAGLIDTFPDRTVADLYAYISFSHWKKDRARQYGAGLERIIPRTMEEFRKKMGNLEECEYPEMKRGIVAFILMSVRGKYEIKIIDKLFELDEVVEIHSVHGDADVLVKIVLSRDLISSDAEIISQFVQDKVRLLNGVNSTKTLIPGFSKVKTGRC
ncbi:MAG: Lrp/AsnC ligand binding domain-containing protein [Pseudomonadota bacterium]